MSLLNTKRRLNKKGRTFYAAKYFLEGYSQKEITKIFEIPVERIPNLLGHAAGFLGLYSGLLSHTSGLTIFSEIQVKTTLQETRARLVAQLEIIIQSHGQKLFTSDEWPSEIKKNLGE